MIASRRLLNTAKDALTLFPNEASMPVLYTTSPYDMFLMGTNINIDANVFEENHFITHNDRNVLILHSSGTTGLPKPIYNAHAYMLGYAACHNFTVEEAAGLSTTTLPLYHVSHMNRTIRAMKLTESLTGIWAPQPLSFFKHWTHHGNSILLDDPYRLLHGALIESHECNLDDDSSSNLGGDGESS